MLSLIKDVIMCCSACIKHGLGFEEVATILPRTFRFEVKFHFNVSTNMKMFENVLFALWLNNKLGDGPKQ